MLLVALRFFKQNGALRGKPVQYREKLNKFVNGEDPYNIPRERWSDDNTNFPPLTYADIFNYLVCETSFYTNQQFKVNEK